MYTIITLALIRRNYAESFRLPAKDASIKAAVKVKISSVKTFDNTFNRKQLRIKMPEHPSCPGVCENCEFCHCNCSDACDACNCDCSY